MAAFEIVDLWSGTTNNKAHSRRSAFAMNEKPLSSASRSKAAIPVFANRSPSASRNSAESNGRFANAERVHLISTAHSGCALSNAWSYGAHDSVSEQLPVNSKGSAVALASRRPCNRSEVSERPRKRASVVEPVIPFCFATLINRRLTRRLESFRRASALSSRKPSFSRRRESRVSRHLRPALGREPNVS